MAEVVLNANTREAVGKREAKKLRAEGKIPGVFYGHTQKNIPIVFESQDLLHILGSEIGLIDLKIDNKKAKKSIIKDMQFDPVSNKLVHLDVMGVKLKEKITVSVPIHFIGEPIGVKEEGGVMNISSHEVEISCLPLDLPEYLDVDVSELKIGDSIHIKDLSFENIEFVSEPDILVVGVITTRAIVEEVEEVEGEEEMAEGEEDEATEEVEE